MPHTARILIVDDHPVFRKGLAHLINEERDMTVCGEAEDVDAARTAFEELEPDMVIIDITLKDKSGLELLSEIQSLRPKIPALIVSMHDESMYAERAFRLGAMGYIMKGEMSDTIIQAIRQVLSGSIYASQTMVSRMVGRLSRKSDPASHPVESLSDRELEVFQLMGKGFQRKEIADLLGVSAKTVGSYRELIKKKLSVNTSGELMREAVEWVSRR
ncbi:LuxR family two component transcriptional regulator [Desulfobotulus alkaliphilus]|uniref:LuxR family two component transcriptional regulator n=1 Tax=Desulfobotulus alkaliphilus TaxID=622671 RepID=A0A562S7W8_9BACT|nr:response regulator transcription factor [Desulfobotulus alkaliphilus]TWI77452.1 LuxR family two component transcriptional regulator [Desulfobotulus alkaliphilus]